MGYRSPTSVPSTPLATRAATVSPSPVTSNLYPIVNTTYQGVLHDLSTDVTSNIALTQIHQNNQSISGYFSSSQVKSTFTGVLDTSKHIFFTVTGNSGQPSLFFEGAVRADGNLAGNYCSIDQQGQCSGNYGVWSLAPM